MLAFANPTATARVDDGLNMNFSIVQWFVLFILDLLIKTLCVYFAALAFSLSVVVDPGLLLSFVPIGVLISGLNLLCLFLVSRLVTRLESFNAGLPPVLKCLLVFFVANTLFVLAWVGFFATIGHSDNGPAEGAVEGLLIGLFLVVTNVIPVLLVALLGRISSLLSPS